MPNKLFRIQTRYYKPSTSQYGEYFFIQKKFLWIWYDVDISGYCYISNKFPTLKSAEEHLNNYIQALEKEMIVNKELKALKKKRKINPSKYYLNESNKLISGDSPEEAQKKLKLKAFL